MKPVPERQLLLAVCRIERVVDIERHRRGRSVVAGTVDIHHLTPDADQRAQVRRIFPARHRRLAGQPNGLSGGLAERHHEGRVVPQGIQVIGVFVPTGNGQHPRPEDVRDAMQHTRRVPVIGDQGGEPIHDAKPPLGLREQQNAGIRRDRATVERGRDFLGPNGWKRE